jgi:hypothetical protein
MINASSHASVTAAIPSFITEICSILNTKKYRKDRNDNNHIRRTDSSSRCADDMNSDDILNMDADILCRSRRNEDHNIEQLDYAILNLISNIKDQDIDIDNANSHYDNRSGSTHSQDTYPNQNKVNAFISDLFITLEYERPWNESPEERLFALTW